MRFPRGPTQGVSRLGWVDRIDHWPLPSRSAGSIRSYPAAGSHHAAQVKGLKADEPGR